MAGAGYKLFNTGDVLTAAQVNTYLMEQTVMVFADAAARTTALSGVVSEGMISYLKDTNAVEVYDGSAWVASDDPNAIQNTIVDAKGDLIAASANDTPARLAVGNNGETLVADSSTSTGLRYNPQNALANPIINGGMDIAQRGTTFSNPASAAYTLDRWFVTAAATGFTVSQQATNDTTNLPNIQYSARFQRNSGQTSTASIGIAHMVETANTIPLAGKAVTLSFYARAGANYSPTSSLMGVQVVTGTGTNESANGSFTGQSLPINTTQAITTTWTRYVFNFSVGATVSEIKFIFYMTGVGTASTDDWFEVTGVQLDLGTYTASTAPTFRRSGGTLAGELAACQRYYYEKGGDDVFEYHTVCQAFSTTQALGTITLPVEMRIVPSCSVSAAGDFTLNSAAGAGQAVTAVTFQRSSKKSVSFSATVAANLVAGNATLLFSNNTTAARIKASAEL